MSKVRVLLVAVLVGALLFGGAGTAAFADVSNATGTNIEEGDNSGSTRQGGRSASGDAVGGQVAGVVSSGRTSVDATNVSRDSSVESGEASGSNTSRSFVGQAASDERIDVGAPSATDLSFITVEDGNVQEGDNRQTIAQTANASTGDGVAGEVIGVVTAAGGSASVVAANTTTNSDVETGDADSVNDSNAFAGLAFADDEVQVGGADISNVTGPEDLNVQEGDNRQSIAQTSNASSGDGVAGQVIGVVSAGATSVDATNRSDDVVVDTGDAETANDSGSFVGHALADENDIDVGVGDIDDVLVSSDANVQEGDNNQRARQAASATTGDGVGGQVIGAVTSAGGSASIVGANTSTSSDVSTGDSDAANEQASFVGLANADDEIEVGITDISNINIGSEANIQEGDNRQSLAQSSTASSGDGVAGQVIGAVSAGATSIDATNRSDDVSVQTGDTEANNESRALVGLAVNDDDDIRVGGQDVENVLLDSEANVQEGDNRQRAVQTAVASSGDAIGGEVIGAVTSAGGSASIVAANTSRTVDVTTGDADAANESDALVGHALPDEDLEVGLADISKLDNNDETNVQEGDNRHTLSQSANSSTGDGVGGQVIGVVSAGATSVDATNLSEDSTAETGDADSANKSAVFVGLAIADNDDVTVGAADVALIDPTEEANVQEGDNTKSLTQSASASSGDAVAGQVLAGVTPGVITGAGGSTSVVVANTSTGIDSSTGDADFSNDDAEFVGLAISSALTL